MKRRVSLIAALAVAGTLSVATWTRAQRNDARSLPAMLPPSALIYLEAKNFHSLIDRWNRSQERARWINSANATVLAQSRLLQRLMQAQGQFETVAGVPVEMSLVNELAGTQSAFAFYDFSNLQFVYITRLDTSRLEQSGLWKTRSVYQTRQVSGISFYTKTESVEGSSRTVAFASHDGWLIVATDAELMARTLTLISGRAAESLAADQWYQDMTKQAAEQGDLRMVYNLAAVRAKPQFQTYWIQGDSAGLKMYTAGIADLFDQPNGFEERRALLRESEAEPANNTALAAALAYVAPAASLYRAWAAPDHNLLAGVLKQVVVGEAPGDASLNRYAPAVSEMAADVGSASDLETKIDEPPYQAAAGSTIDKLQEAILAMHPLALLHNQTTQLTPDGVFVRPESELVIVCDKPNASALIDAGGSALDPVRVTADGQTLILSRMSAHAAVKAPALRPGETYAAGYEHAVAWPHYQKLFDVIDKSAVSPEMAAASSAPAFFSGNVRSLGDSLYRLQRASIVTQDQPLVTRDTVRYEFAAK